MRMNKRTALSLFVLSGMILCLSTGCAQQVTGYKDLKYPTLSEITVPEVERVTLSNGMQLFLLEDHELPLISLSARIRTGSMYEPADKIGLANITGTVMRTGGTTSKTGDELDEELESIAAS
ncbi:MAG: insulinase family protein, partial [Phycisphaerales bacterium]